MKIVVTGTRGIPNIQGGVETHCEQLYPRIQRQGIDVTIIRRKGYTTDNLTEFKGVKLIDIPSPRKKSFEAIIHTFRAAVKAKKLHADILHVHAIGPALVIPFARMLGMKVVMTNHGPDYDREKWGRMAKFMLRLGERLGTRFSNEVIVISPLIASNLKKLYGRDNTNLIFNGVETPTLSTSTDYLTTLGVEPGKYVLALGRFVKEKNFHLLIEAFSKANLEGIKLVIAGDADHEDEYSENLKKMAQEQGVVLTGFVKGERLRQLLSHARLFVLPSTHEGLPISLLEAMSYGREVLVSDIEANRLPELTKDDFFATGSLKGLREALQRKIKKAYNTRNYNLSNYNWDEIARKTLNVYRKIYRD